MKLNEKKEINDKFFEFSYAALNLSLSHRQVVRRSQRREKGHTK